MKTPDGEVMFCAGCSSQGEFVDVVTQEAAHASVSYAGSSRETPSLRVELAFTDQDGGVNVPVTYFVHPSVLEKTGLEVRRNDNGAIAYKDRTDRIIKRALEKAKPTVVERIGRCASIGSGSTCPAMSRDVFEKIIIQSLTDRNKK